MYFRHCGRKHVISSLFLKTPILTVLQLTQYRLMSILPILSKVIKALDRKQLYSYLTNNSLLCPYQSGFHYSHSIVGLLLNVAGNIRGAVDSNKTWLAQLVDINKGVDINKVCKRLYHTSTLPSVFNFFSLSQPKLYLCNLFFSLYLTSATWMQLRSN